MRVLFVVHGFPPTAAGGTEIYASDLAHALRRLGHEVAVLTRVGDTARREYEVTRDDAGGVPVIRVNNTFLRAASFTDSYRNGNIDAIAGAVLDEFRPDVVHVHHLTCLSTGIVRECEARRIPTVVTLQDYWLLCHRGQLLDLDLARCAGPSADRCARCAGLAASGTALPGRIVCTLRAAARRLPPALATALQRGAAGASHLAALPGASGETARRLDEARAVWSGATLLLSPSRTLHEQFARFGAPLAKMRRQEQGIDLGPYARTRPPSPGYGEPRQSASRGGGRFAPHPAGGSAPYPGERLRVGFLGSLMVSKAPHLLLEAAAGLEDGVTVTVAGAVADYHGDASYSSRILPLLRRPGVSWRGPVAHDEVPAFLASIDVLVVPSIWIENSPFVIREARAAGAVVVASNLGGMAEAVSDGRDGLLFEPGSSTDLRRVLRRLLDEPGLLERLRQGIPASRSIDDDAAWTCGVYEEAVARAGGPPIGSQGSTAAVVLNYRTPDDTLLAVRSLEASRSGISPIVVVDNAGDGSCADTLSAGRAEARVLPTSANLGFSGGCNVGIRAALDAGAERVFLLNSDAVAAPDTIALLERVLAGEPRAGIVAPLIVYRGDPRSVASAGLSYNPRTGRMRHLGFGQAAGQMASEPPRKVTAVSGCAMLIRREVFEDAGLFDERYFYSFEDIDFCWRAALAGWETWLVPSAVVCHEGNGSIGRESADALYYAARNHQLLARTAAPLAPPASWLRAGTIVALNAAHALRSGTRHPSALRAVARGTFDHFRGRYGRVATGR